jgi:hypothetical protein
VWAVHNERHIPCHAIAFIDGISTGQEGEIVSGLNDAIVSNINYYYRPPRLETKTMTRSTNWMKDRHASTDRGKHIEAGFMEYL